MSVALQNIRIVLCETHHPGNIGAAARAMKTMGLSRLVLVDPRQFPHADADLRASRATDVLRHARVCATLPEALSGVTLAVACTARSRELSAPQVDVRAAAARVIEAAQRQPVALVFGNETYGLTTDQVQLCQLIATIPANPRYSSLNLAAAVQVFAYELRMHAAGGALPVKPRALASQEAVEGFYAHLESALLESGFLNPRQPKKLMQRMRRLFARAQLEREEVNILRGVVRTLRAPKTRASIRKVDVK